MTSAAAPTKSILHVAGFSTCGFYQRCASVVASLSLLFPHRLQLVKHEFPSRDEYRNWLIAGNFRDEVRVNTGNLRAGDHASSPFCWLASGTGREAESVKEFIGGHDDTLDWCRRFAAPSQTTDDDDTSSLPTMKPDGHDPSHPYEYDLVVIGGGSGGLAASKEAASFGARVAVLDYVKPSPAGSSWGLGGTCVNVGCIPKKLMHHSAVLNGHRKFDAPHFGVGVSSSQFEEWMGTSQDITDDDGDTMHHWELLKTNVQNHIRGLNFKYRVDLREKNVTYLNKLGSFLDKNTVETIDKKGNRGTVTASRFLIAVGGRPTPLHCEGGELAISSDDIFSLNRDPGKVLCVGASYISLECAGFLRGIGKDVTVAVRSILLRGFDRECADKIGDYMKSEGVKFKEEVLPVKLVKTDGGKIDVTFSNGDREEFDTVLAAIGRTGDTEKLGLENAGVRVNSKNAKISAKLEQSSVPNIYVIGDVMDGCPELTPVAIHAGRMLSRRLFGGSPSSIMDYRKICTTVFTPIEYSTVGYSEEDAKSEYGDNNVQVYHKYFIPLEWSLSHSRSEHQGFCKAIVDKTTRNVLGLHYLGPNAGEVMQGFGTAMKLGCKFEDIIETVGIHPTTAEEFTTLSITKESGADAKASGC